MKKSNWMLRPLLVGGVIGALAAAGYASGILGSWDNRSLDLLFLPHAPDPSITVVAIDDASLTQIGRWPWPRSVHADLINKLQAAGARVIGYDVNFPEPSDQTDDQALAAALKSADDVVLPVELQMSFTSHGLTYDNKRILQPIAELASSAKSTGHVNSPPDSDNVYRRLPLKVGGADNSYVPSFESEILRLAGQADALKAAPLDGFGRMIVNYPGAPNDPKSFRIISAVNMLHGTSDLTPLKNGIVLVGATAADLHDSLLVPTSGGLPMPGVEVHASAIDTVLGRHWLNPLPVWAMVLFLFIVGLLIGLMLPRMRARWSLLLTIFIWACVVVGAFLLFDRGWLLSILWPSLTLVFAYAAVTLERRIAADRQRRELKNAFSRYVSPSVVETIIADPSHLELGGERKRMSVLFSDICGFTSISEGLSPEKLVEILNIYLSRMTAIVFENRGVLDKYIGDAVMAFWNAPFEQPDHAWLAVSTALKMQQVLDEMNKAKAFGEVEIRIGVGINTGDMVVGNVGGETRFDYTVIGDNVNLGSRLEGLTRTYGVGVIVSETTYNELKDRIVARRLDKVAVKGKKEPVIIFEVLAETHTATDEQKKLAADFEAALDKYLAKDFAGAGAACNTMLKAFPADAPTNLLKDRAEQFKTTPPPLDWNGTWVYTKK